MERLVENEKNLVTDGTNDKLWIALELLDLMLNDNIVKTKHIKRKNYKYNCTNKQTLKLTFENGYKHEYENLPTMGGLFNLTSLYDEIRNEIKKEVK